MVSASYTRGFDAFSVLYQLIEYISLSLCVYPVIETKRTS